MSKKIKKRIFLEFVQNFRFRGAETNGGLKRLQTEHNAGKNGLENGIGHENLWNYQQIVPYLGNRTFQNATEQTIAFFQIKLRKMD